MNIHRTFLCGVIVVVLLASCNLPSSRESSVADPLIPDTGRNPSPTLSSSLEFLPTTTFTDITLPTMTPAIELTSTFDIPTATEQSVIQNAYVFAPQNTNCRLGPDVIYPAVGYLLLGETSEIVARNPQGTWVAINNLDAPGICYVSLSVVEVHGIESITLLTIFTPLPPPTLTWTPLPPLFTQTPRQISQHPTITYTAEPPIAPNPDKPRIDVDPGMGPAGTVFTFLIRDFKPFEQVTIVIENYDDIQITSFVTTMDANGDKDESWTSPNDLPVSSYSVNPFDSTGKAGKSGTFLIIPTN